MTDPVPVTALAGDAGQLARRALAVSGVLEPITLLVLLVNLATVHVDGVAALVGPLHGTAYLVAVIASWAGRCPGRARLLVWVPNIGALLAARVAAPPPALSSGGAHPPIPSRE